MSGEQTLPICGRWYIANYGFETVCGPCVAVGEHVVILSFRWGTPFRYRHALNFAQLLVEVPPPWHVRVLRAALRAIAQQMRIKGND